jgi:hypothetical protein
MKSGFPLGEMSYNDESKPCYPYATLNHIAGMCFPPNMLISKGTWPIPIAAEVIW